MSNIDFEKLETIKVDVAVGFGDACRVASALKRNRLRYFSNPFDWMMKYSLNTVYSLLKSFHDDDRLDFFVHCYEDKTNASKKCTGVVDSDSGMVSMHDFPQKMPIERAPEFFQVKYRKRFRNLDKALKNAKKVCFITNRKISLDEMEIFINQIKQLYNFEHIYYINIYDSDKESFNKIENSDETYLIFKFNDEHKNGRDKTTNPDFWRGNIEYWDKILNKIKLNKKYVLIFKINKIVSDFVNRFSMGK